ncbi:MAG: leucyl/phenylalanyl-tRNA--protein transferase [Planctomycetota bacterium]
MTAQPTMPAPLLTPQLVLQAYAAGAFPMADGRNGPIHWLSPDPRAIFPILADDPVGAFHTPRSLRKLARRQPLTLRLDADFPAVIDACAAPRAADRDTWISPDIQRVFNDLHRAGFAHSIEAYDANDQLVGGLYGIALRGAFFGESMFSRVPNASRLCLAHTVTHLQHQGFTLFDVQFTNPHLEQFGVAEVPRDDYLRRLQHALKLDVSFTPTTETP